MKVPAFKVRYAFSSKQLPFGLAELHAEYAREALEEAFEIEPSNIIVSHGDKLEDGEDVELVAYSSRTSPSATLIVKASQAVLPAYRATLKQGQRLIAAFNAWQPRTPADPFLLAVQTGLAPQLHRTQREALEAMACEVAGVGTGDAEFMADDELARVIVAAHAAAAQLS